MTVKDSLPVDNFTDAYPFLRRPFTPAAIRFKLQSSWDGGAMAIAYIDARLAAGRMNHVIPAKWSPVYERTAVGSGLICHLTVDGITRTDYGAPSGGPDAEVNIKGTFSDALKRAAVHFGVGECLYVLPKMVLREGQHLKKNKKNKYVLTDQGEGHLRNRYTMWLDSGGREAFGEPLDHGDTLEPDAPEPELSAPLELLTEAADEADVPQDVRKEMGAWIHASGELDEGRAKQAAAAINAGAVGELLEDIGKAA